MNTITTILSAIALVISILSYLHAKSIKTIDLRIEAKKGRDNVHQALCELKQSHSGALAARKALNGARGLLNSGATQKYEEAWKKNAEAIKTTEGEFNQITTPSLKSSSAQLEETIVNFYKLRTQISVLQSHYDQDAAYNEQQRAELRADRRELP